MIYRKMQEAKQPLKIQSYVHAGNRYEINTVITVLFPQVMSSRIHRFYIHPTDAVSPMEMFVLPSSANSSIRLNATFLLSLTW